MSSRPRHPVSLAGPHGVVAAATAMSVAVALAAGAPRFGVPALVAFAAGALVGTLAVAALPSFPTRVATASALAAGGFVLTRYARSGAVSAAAVLIWSIVTIVAFVALDRAESATRPALRRRTRPWGHEVTAIAIPTVVAVVVAGIVLWPVLAVAGDGSERGDPADPFADAGAATLTDREHLDTTTRPHLGDAVVMSVTADHPAFWRGATFDAWDGATWTRSETAEPSLLLRPGPGDPLLVPRGAGVTETATRVNRQTFEVVADYADIVFAAPEATEVDSDHLIDVRDDGTLVAAFDPFGRGARYSVRSAEPAATADSLRAATGGVPHEVASLYAQPPVATDRVRALARSITAAASTDYDAVRAVEAWLATHVEYSLAAPLPPPGTADTVDWFVFDGRAGWCEQIASTLVVMSRELGIPARLATGFVPGEHDRLTGRYTVRERDAHAWAEVWFPGVGWVGFDPTAAVPLAGDSAAPASIFDWVRTHGPLLGVVALAGFGLVVVALGGGLRPLVRRVRRVRRGRRGRDVAAPTWAASVLDRLEAIGVEHGRPRSAAETPTRYAAALAETLGPDAGSSGPVGSDRVGPGAFAVVGAVIDEDAWSPRGASSTRRAEALAAIDRLERVLP